MRDSIKMLFNSSDLKDTQQLASKIGRNLRGGETIELISDIGGGKTTLVKGMVLAAGSQDFVSSPSFTIRNDYSFNGGSIAHFDFYRLSDPGIIRDMLVEEIANPRVVVMVEWSKIVEDVLPKKRVVINIKTTGLDSRQISIDTPQEFAYLLAGEQVK